MVAEIVSKSINLTAIFIEKDYFNKEIFDFSHYINAKLFIINNSNISEMIPDFMDIGISYGFGYRFKKEEIDLFQDGILNIHTGDLPKYRSRHPISWAMIEGEKEIGITFHKIDEQIDMGYLVHKFFIDRSFNDDLNALQDKIESALKKEFSIAINKITMKNFEKLPPSKYYKRINEIFDVVNPSEINSHALFSLFMSQKIYGGVNILGQKKKECHIYNALFESEYLGFDIHKCADNIYVAVK